MKGSLKNTSFQELITNLAGDQKTGVLKIRSGKVCRRIIFKEGSIVYSIEESVRDLGEELLKWEPSLNVHRERIKSEAEKGFNLLIEYLSGTGVIDISSLRNFLYINTKNLIFGCALLKKGDFEFTEEAVDYNPSVFSLVNTDFMNMETAKIRDEWIHVSSFYPGDSFIISKIEGDQKISSEGLTEAEKNILDKSDGVSTSLEIISKTRLPQIEAKIALSWLNQKQLIKIKADEKKRAINLSAVKRGILQGISAIIIMFLVFFGLLISPLNPGKNTHSPIKVKTNTILQNISSLQKQKIAFAIEVYRWETGHYPNSLNDLVASKLLFKDDLTYPWVGVYYYNMNQEGFILLDPRR